MMSYSDIMNGRIVHYLGRFKMATLFGKGEAFGEAYLERPLLVKELRKFHLEEAWEIHRTNLTQQETTQVTGEGRFRVTV